MDIAAQQGYQGEMREDSNYARVIAGGSLAEGIAGAAAVALAIIALAGIMPRFLLSIATILVGAAFLFESGAISSRIGSIYRDVGKGHTVSEIGGGVTAEFIAGLTGVALGILALIGIVPLTLIPVAVIVFGASLLIGSTVTGRINSYIATSQYPEGHALRSITNDALMAASGVQVLIGLGAIVLGILALIGYKPLVLSLVGVLCVGVADLLSGTAISSRFMGVFRR